MIRVILVLALILPGCKPTCADLVCLSRSLELSDITGDVSGAGTKLQLSTVATTRFADEQSLDNADGGANADDGLSLTVSPQLRFETSAAFDVLFFTFTDPLACRPALCMTACPRNLQCLGSTRCTPTLRDGLRSGSGFFRVEYSSQPASELSYELAVTPVSAPGCPVDVVPAIEDGTALVGPSGLIDVHFPGADGTGLPTGGGGGGAGATGGGSGGTGGGACLAASSASCTPLGTSGVTSTCISPADYTAQTGLQLPPTCAAEGTTGCLNDRGTLVKPCCPGLTCRAGNACGGGTTAGGVCAR